MGWNICGHETAVAFLKEHTKPEKLRHAYLITGPQGIGRRTLALAFVKALNCQNPPAPGEFCDVCTVCRQINAQSFADLTVLAPEEGHQDLRIDQIRVVQQSLALAPYQAKYRVVLILDFQRATAAASNALLKSLEEPPARAVLVLTADAEENLLPTIASRCQIVRLRPLPMEKAGAWLEEKLQVPKERAALLAHLSSGRVGAAVRFEQDPELLSAYEEALDKLQELLCQKRRQRLQYVEGLQKKKGSQRELAGQLVSAWLTFWRDLLIVRSGAEMPLVNQERQDFLRDAAEQMNLARIETILERHEKSLGQLDAYVNPRLTLEYLLLTLPILKSSG
ncbi:MAG: DNA polymerase III subunit delta' [Anaerolineaceae bacterium]